MFKPKPTLLPAAEPQTPPTPEQVFNGASAASAYARSTFQDAVDELTAANEALAEVYARTTSQIASLVILRESATQQKAANESTISKLQELIG